MDYGSQRNEVPDNAALQAIAFISKTLISMETCYSNTEREALGIPHGLEKNSPLLFHLQSEWDYRSPVTGGILKGRWCKCLPQVGIYLLLLLTLLLILINHNGV